MFPEINIDKVEFVQGMDITIVITGGSRRGVEGIAPDLGFPFRREPAATEHKARA